MSRINELHEEAMSLSDLAFIEKRRGNHALARRLYRQAFILESAAADILKDDPSAEPTRSVLYRSAASLAIDCDELSAAEHLITSGLVGSPPEEIKDELNDLLKYVRSKRPEKPLGDSSPTVVGAKAHPKHTSGSGVLKLRLRELLAQREAALNRRIRLVEVAQATRIPVNTLTAMINNQIDQVSLQDLAQLCVYFHCTPQELFQYSDDLDPDSTDPVDWVMNQKQPGRRKST